MASAALTSLIQLIDNPEKFRAAIDHMRDNEDIEEAVAGFILRYDELNGDVRLLKEELLRNKTYILQQLPSNEKMTIRPIWVKYAAIFSVLLVSGVFSYLYFSRSDLEFQSTYMDPGIPNFMNSTQRIQIEKPLFYLKKGEVQLANESILPLLKRFPENDTVIYYSAYINYQLGNQEEAQLSFKKLAATKSKFAYRSAYFIGLYLVEKRNYSEAIEQFKCVKKSADEVLTSFANSHIRALRAHLQKQ